MIRQCHNHEFEVIYSIINDAAQAYKGIIPADRWKEPYMSRDGLRHEMMDEGDGHSARFHLHLALGVAVTTSLSATGASHHCLVTSSMKGMMSKHGE